jgi:DNA-binding transcriptional ArsR family regulator
MRGGRLSVHISSAVWRLKLEPAAKLIMLALADMANDEGICWPSVASLLTRTGLSESTVRRHLGELEAGGLLKKHERPGRSTVYRVLPPEKPAETTTNSGSSSYAQGCHGDGGVTVTGVSPRQDTPVTVTGGGVMVTGEGCHHDTQIRNRSSYSNQSDPGTAKKRAVDKFNPAMQNTEPDRTPVADRTKARAAIAEARKVAEAIPS